MLPYAMLGGAQLAVGAAAIFARYALAGAAPLAVAAARLAIAAIILFALGVIRRRAHRVHTPRERRIFAFAGAALALHFSTWIWSLEYTSVAISTLLVSSTPIWIASYEALVRGRGLSRTATIAFLAGGLGLVMVVSFNRAAPPQSGHALLGAALALLGGLAIGVYLLLVREVRDAFDTQTIVTRTYGWAAAFLVLAALAARQPPPPLEAGSAWAGILAMAFVSQLLGHTAMNASLRFFSPSAISFATLLEPVFAGILALVVFHEALTPLAIGGGLILLGSIATVLREERREVDCSGLPIGPVQ